jgi:hypothetical protein
MEGDLNEKTERMNLAGKYVNGFVAATGTLPMMDV